MLASLALAFPEIDPVLLQIGPLTIRWYSLAYIAGVLGGWWYIARLNRSTVRFCTEPVLSKKALDDIVVWAILGVVLGGRLGYVLFYQPGYYLAHPSQILHLWEGGMSFHGGVMGVIIAMAWFCRKYQVAFFRLMDLVACVVPIGLFFGRLANFINGELYGRATDVPWAVVFPTGGEVPRHPSQLYEAVLEGLILFAVLSLLAWKTRALNKPTLLSGVFLAGYGLSRFVVEFVREPDAHLGMLTLGMTMGQWLSAPMLLLGLALIIRAQRLGEQPCR